MLAAFGLRTFREQFVKITVNNFLLRIYLIVFTEYGVERLNLRQRNLIELDYPIALTRRVENVIIYYYCPLNFKDSKNVWLER